MKKILGTLLVLLVSSNVYGMENDEKNEVMRKLGEVKAKSDTFAEKNLEQQQDLLIESLNCWREAKRTSKQSLHDKAKVDLPEYEGFDLNTKSFLPTTVLQFLTKKLPIQDIISEEINGLIKHAINDASINIQKAKLLTGTRGLVVETKEEDLKNDRHILLWNSYDIIQKYKKAKLQVNNQIKCSLFPILENHSLKFRLIKVEDNKNKSAEIKICLKNIRQPDLICLREELISDRNTLCNDKCILQSFKDFSSEELFHFHNITQIKRSEIGEISRAYQTECLSNIFNIFSEPVSQTKPVSSVSQKTLLFIQPIQPKPTTLALKREQMRKKLENKERGQNNSALKQQLITSQKEQEVLPQIQSLGKPQPEPQSQPVNHSQIQVQDILQPQNQRNIKPRPQKEKKSQSQQQQQNEKKPQNQQQQKAQAQHKAEQGNATKISSSLTNKASLRSLPTLVTNVNGVMAVIGESQPYDGQGGFIPVNAKKLQTQEAQNKVSQNNNRGRGRGRGQFQDNERKTPSNPVSIPVKTSEPPQPVQFQPINKNISYSAMLQNLRLPATPQTAIVNDLGRNKQTLKNENTISLRPIPQNSEIYSPLTYSADKKKRSFLENPTGDFLISKPKTVVQVPSDDQDKAKPIIEEKVEPKLPVSNQYQPSVSGSLRDEKVDQKSETTIPSVHSPNFAGAIHYGIETFEIPDLPIIEKILIQRGIVHSDNIQRDIIHIYPKGYGELTKAMEKKDLELKQEKALRKRAEQELQELQKKLAQLESEKK